MTRWMRWMGCGLAISLFFMSGASAEVRIQVTGKIYSILSSQYILETPKNLITIRKSAISPFDLPQFEDSKKTRVSLYLPLSGIEKIVPRKQK